MGRGRAGTRARVAGGGGSRAQMKIRSACKRRCGVAPRIVLRGRLQSGDAALKPVLAPPPPSPSPLAAALALTSPSLPLPHPSPSDTPISAVPDLQDITDDKTFLELEHKGEKVAPFPPPHAPRPHAPRPTLLAPRTPRPSSITPRPSPLAPQGTCFEKKNQCRKRWLEPRQCQNYAQSHVRPHSRC